MIMMTRRKIYLTCITLLTAFTLQAQKGPLILDRVVAVVGDFQVLQSDIEQQYLQMKAGQSYMPEGVRCEIFNFFIQQKLLMNQAKIDSIVVSPAQVELQMEARLEAFINQIGSEKALEEYFNKSIYDIKDDLRDAMREMMITQEVEMSITGDIKITPSEVRDYYEGLHPDSIPYIDSEVKVAQIVTYPSYSEDAVFEVKERLLELRKRIMEGENFATLAILYSDGPSASRGGELGFMPKSNLDPAYVDAAWSLKKGQVSKIVETEFGFHIIQVIERRGDMVNTRHILLKPTVSAQSKQQALSKLDSLRTAILNDSITFELAAKRYSEDEKTSVNGGLLVNPATNAATFKLDELDSKDYYTVREIEVGDVSEPYETETENGKLAYKMIKLKMRTEPHRANLEEDYLLLQNLAMEKKKQEVMQKWYREKRAETYIRIDEAFSHCAKSDRELTAR